MPDNNSPAAQPESGAEPSEFNFDKASSETPRLKRRSLKAKSGPPKEASAPAGRDAAPKTVPAATENVPVKAVPATPIQAVSSAKPEPAPGSVATAPPRSKPAVSIALTSAAAASRAATGATTSSQRPATVHPAATTTPKTVSPAASVTSPHGTRPATLYYTSHPKKEATASMKTNSTAASAGASNSASTGPSPGGAAASASRPAAAASAPISAAVRPAAVAGAPRAAASNVDYRANVERQTREQKSVGNLLSYIVYAVIAALVLGGCLAGYGAKVIFDQLHDQSATIGDLDAKYDKANSEMTVRLAAQKETLSQTQAQLARQLELINKQQEDINRLLAAATDSTNALKAERQSRLLETAALRARLREVENKNTIQKF